VPVGSKGQWLGKFCCVLSYIEAALDARMKGETRRTVDCMTQGVCHFLFSVTNAWGGWYDPGIFSRVDSVETWGSASRIQVGPPGLDVKKPLRWARPGWASVGPGLSLPKGKTIRLLPNTFNSRRSSGPRSWGGTYDLSGSPGVSGTGTESKILMSVLSAVQSTIFMLKWICKIHIIVGQV
jgi:hypothetical protein